MSDTHMELGDPTFATLAGNTGQASVGQKTCCGLTCLTCLTHLTHRRGSAGDGRSPR